MSTNTHKYIEISLYKHNEFPRVPVNHVGVHCAGNKFQFSCLHLLALLLCISLQAFEIYFSTDSSRIEGYIVWAVRTALV
jgi:hypothetical protein